MPWRGGRCRTAGHYGVERIAVPARFPDARRVMHIMCAVLDDSGRQVPGCDARDQRRRVACAAVPAPPVRGAVLEADDASDGPLIPHARRRHGLGAGLMTVVDANGVSLGVEHFGDATAPLILLAGGLDDRRAHLAGLGVGGMVAQVAALDHPDAFSALTLAGTRPVAPGPPDDDLPDHDAATMGRLFAHPMPDWPDREAVAEFAAAGAEILGDDPVAARTIAARIWDRTPGTAPPVQMANQMGMVFSKLDCEPRWRERLPEIEVPTLVVHGRRDPFFPVGNGEAIAREIPGARLLILEEAATAIPDAAAGEVAEAMLALG